MNKEIVELRVSPRQPVLINGERVEAGDIAHVRGARNIGMFAETPEPKHYAGLSGEDADGKRDYWLSDGHTWRKGTDETEFRAHLVQAGKDWEVKFERQQERAKIQEEIGAAEAARRAEARKQQATLM